MRMGWVAGALLVLQTTAWAGWIKMEPNGSEVVTTQMDELWSPDLSHKVGTSYVTRIVLKDKTTLTLCEYSGEGAAPEGCLTAQDGTRFLNLVSQVQAGVIQSRQVLKSEVCDGEGRCTRQWETQRFQLVLLLTTGESRKIISYQVLEKWI